MKSNCSSTSKSIEHIKSEHWKLLPHRRQFGATKAAQIYQQSVESAGDSVLYLSTEAESAFLWQIVSWNLAWDSNFFGFKTAKMDLISPPDESFSRAKEDSGCLFLQESLHVLKSNGFEFLTAQVEVSDTAAMQCLELSGFVLADTIVAYELALDKRNDLNSSSRNVRVANSADEMALRAVASECFGDRKVNVNRFNSELKFSQKQICQMYELWVANSVKGALADQVFIYEEDGAPLGFITMRLPSERETGQGLKSAVIPLNAVSVKHQGKGIYRQLVHAALLWLKDQNCTAVQIKTQLPNLAVHSCWQSLGGRIFQSLHTFQKDLAKP